ncbi:MAG TPA: hypothetical protein VFF52_24085 [Isosphaeraceae bacterium]|nr:hypothetical protein [Isosphaeraceae bacterium]
MSKTRKQRRPSRFRRLVYLLMLVSGGGGGWMMKDHPRVQALWMLLTGQPAEGNGAAPDGDGPGALAKVVAGLLEAPEEFRQPGTYQVAIPRVHLDPSLFKAGHTVDIQARVLKLDPRGRSTTLWETKPYGEQLAVAGKDELSAGWPQRPFQVEWHPGERLLVEVYDQRPGLFVEPRRFHLAPPESEPREFPLKPGTFPLEPADRPDPPVDPRNNTIVLRSHRVGDLPAPATSRADDDRPLVIK